MNYVMLVPYEHLGYQDANGNTLMHIAVSNNDVDTVMYLIKSGVNSNVKNNKGFTPLMYASRYSFTECAQLLLFTKSNL